MEPYAETSVPPRLMAAGMGRRLAALFVDVLLLSAVGGLLELALSGVPALHGGPWRVALEAALLVGYLAGFGGSWGGGQTLGKRLLRIKVIGEDGRPLRPLRAAVRSGILVSPAVAVNLGLALHLPVVLQSALLVAALGIGPALVYLWLFNRRGHRSLHDLLTRSFVVPASAYPVPHRSEVWGGHIAIVLGVCVFMAFLPMNLQWTSDAMGLGPEGLAQLEAVRTRLRQIPGVSDVAISKRWEWLHTVGGRSRESVGLEVIIQTRSGEVSEGVIDAAARELLARYPDADEAQFLRIHVQRVRRLLLAQFNTGVTHIRTPAEWRAKLGISGRI